MTNDSTPKRIGIYVCIGSKRNQVKEYVTHCLRQYRSLLDTLVVVTEIEAGDAYYDEIKAVADRIVAPGRSITWTGDGYKIAVDAIGLDVIRQHSDLVLFDSSFFGPIFPAKEAFDVMAARGCDVWSMTYFDPNLDKRFKLETSERIMHWNFAVVGKSALQSEAFQRFWREVRPGKSYQSQFVDHEASFTTSLIAAGFKPQFFCDAPDVKTGDPRFFQAMKLVQRRCPIVQSNVFTVDPIIHEMQAIQARRALDAIEELSDYDTGLIWRGLLPHNQLRTLHTNLEQLDIIPDVRINPEKTTWDFGGKIAVVMHLYYSDMIAEMRPLIEQLPCDFDLLITTSSADDRAFLLEQLADFKRGELVVKVVEQNRGRDMSSLFISYREEMLSGKYGLVLRLHSKRTPQVSAHLGDWFKDHCLLNLVPNRAYIANLLDKLEKNPDIGVAAPPLIHMAFGTLGHSWFANRKPAMDLAKEMGITVPFDADTPVAAYGTMYWFRPRALERMFAWPWKWEDYNPEPHHVDGGIAHVQERLICYAAQADNYRTLMVMSPAIAVRNYVTLEYKLQLLASRLPSADIRRQYEYILQANRILGSAWAKTIKITGSFVAKNANKIYRTIKRTATRTVARGNGR